MSQSQALNSYDSVELFLRKAGIEFIVGEPEQLVNELWGDGNIRYRFPVTFKRGKKSFTVNFWQSLAEQDNLPIPGDVLACLQKYDPGTHEEFCSDFGYDVDSIKARTIFRACRAEYRSVSRFFTEEEIEFLQELVA